MKIVLLDGGAVNPGDLCWQGLHRLSQDVHIYEHSREDQIVPRALGCEILITNKMPITREIIECLPGLRCILVTATGYNNIDIHHAAQKNIPVCNVPAYSSPSVAQLVFALLLELTNGVAQNNASVQAGDWQRATMYTYPVTRQMELCGKTMGIVGFGSIAQAVAHLAHAFGMRVIVTNRTKREVYDFVEFVSLEELLEESDVISLHTALGEGNKKMIDQSALEKMKPSAILINTARGGLIDEAALIRALESERIAGAALDVITTEPMEQGSPLLGVKNLLITPHIAFTTVEARTRLIELVLDNAQSFLGGTPQNVVNL